MNRRPCEPALDTLESGDPLLRDVYYIVRSTKPHSCLSVIAFAVPRSLPSNNFFCN